MKPARLELDVAQDRFLDACITLITPMQFFNAINDERSYWILASHSTILEFVTGYEHSNQVMPTDVNACRVARSRQVYRNARAENEADLRIRTELSAAHVRLTDYLLRINVLQPLVASHIAICRLIIEYSVTPPMIIKFPAPVETFAPPWEAQNEPEESKPFRRNVAAIERPERSRTIRGAKPIQRSRNQTTLSTKNPTSLQKPGSEKLKVETEIKVTAASKRKLNSAKALSAKQNTIRDMFNKKQRTS